MAKQKAKKTAKRSRVKKPSTRTIKKLMKKANPRKSSKSLNQRYRDLGVFDGDYSNPTLGNLVDNNPSPEVYRLLKNLEEKQFNNLIKNGNLGQYLEKKLSAQSIKKTNRDVTSADLKGLENFFKSKDNRSILVKKEIVLSIKNDIYKRALPWVLITVAVAAIVGAALGAWIV